MVYLKSNPEHLFTWIKRRGLETSILLAFVIFTGCSSLGRLSKDKPSLHVPAGVDSTVAAEADSIADGLFVTLEREKKAGSFKDMGKAHTSASDTLWKYLTAVRDSFPAVSESDSIQAIEAFNAAARYLQELAALEQRSKADGLSQELIEAKVYQLLQMARHNFERALILNPFDLETRSWLARVYQSLAARFLNEDDHKKAVKILENLTRLERGEHALYARLAESYYALERWEEAYTNFARAEAVLRGARGLDFNNAGDAPEDAPVDTASLFYYVYYQGDTQAKLHRSERALMDLERAKAYPSTEAERADIQSYIDWINWDDGNVAAVELRDRCLKLEANEEHKDAAKGYKRLLAMLNTPQARDEINWRLALLEFQHLDKKDDGIARLQRVVQGAPKDETGAPVDSTYQEYFNSYGVMCHNLGLEYFKKDRKVAFIYFKQAVAVEWENKAKSYLEIAKLSRNNPRAVLENCEQALALQEQLNEPEQMQVYRLLVEASKRLGQFDRARTYYGEWVELRRNSQRSSRR